MAVLRERCRGLSLGLFAGDMCNLRQSAETIAGLGASMIHFDVMDGCFVPDLTAGPSAISGLGVDAVMDVHLMVEHPANHVAAYVNAGADIIAVHAEAENASEAIPALRAAANTAVREVLAGVALMPGTSLRDAAPVLDQSPDLVLVLALDPRTGGRVDISRACRKVAEIRAALPEAVIAFDGGVTLDTFPEIAAAKPDIVVSGSAVMRADDPAGVFQRMTQMLT